ncbi:hypothetical protein N806_24670 [Rhodococcus sp. P27]|nr:hypothetical protein N806_24670 [Rhodococcus sp. P27]
MWTTNLSPVAVTSSGRDHTRLNFFRLTVHPKGIRQNGASPVITHNARQGLCARRAAAALTIAASGIAAASTTISPATATPVTATSSGLSFVTTGGLELYCTSVSGTGITPAAPGNVNSGTGGISINIANVGLSGCDLEGVPATMTTSGSWALNVNADSGSPMGSIKIPNGGAHVVAGGCVIDVTASTAGPVPYRNNTYRHRQQHRNGELHLQRGKRIMPGSRGRNSEDDRGAQVQLRARHHRHSLSRNVVAPQPHPR